MIRKLQIYNKMKLFCFGILIIGGLTLVPLTALHAQSLLIGPPCQTSTCISGEMIGVAKGALVKFDKMASFYDLLAFDMPCVQPQPTDVVVQKQIKRAILPFPDIFCTNQGCFPAVAQGAAKPAEECN
jgi:hypothetical protein